MSAEAGATERTYITDPPHEEPPAPAREPEPAGPAPAVPGGSSSLEIGSGSLADRIRGRREALQGEQQITLELPGYEGILAAEFRLLGWTEGRKIGRANLEETDESLQFLYTSADCILAAHLRFFEVKGSDEHEVPETWHTLCARADIRLSPDVSDRVAMIALLEDVGVVSLWSEYEAWRVNRGRRIAAAVVRDFAKTG